MSDTNDADAPFDYENVPVTERLDYYVDPEPYDPTEGAELVRAKGVMDGATTLSQAADRLEALARSLREAEASSKQLTGPVEDGYAYYA